MSPAGWLSERRDRPRCRTREVTCASSSRVFDWTSSGLARPEKRSMAKRLSSVARSVTFESLGMGRVCRVHALGMVKRTTHVPEAPCICSTGAVMAML